MTFRRAVFSKQDGMVIVRDFAPDGSFTRMELAETNLGIEVMSFLNANQPTLFSVSEYQQTNHTAKEITVWYAKD